MKQKYFLIGALLILLLFIGWMVTDLFLAHPKDKNPWEYDLAALRMGDTTQAMYTEIHSVEPVFTQIHGIATDEQGNIYLCGNDSLEIFDTGFIQKAIISHPGTANCIHVDKQMNILLGMGDHLEILDSRGGLKTSFPAPANSVVITSIASNGDDIFVADAGNKVVYRYSYSGRLVGRIGMKDPAKGIQGFIIPSPYFDLAIGPDQQLWVVNPGRHQFEKYDKEGNLLTSWKKSSMDVSGFCGCCNPSHIAILPNGAFATSEKSIQRIKLYDEKGNFICLVALPSSFAEGTKGLDLAIGNQGEILVLDPQKHQLRVFKRKG